MILALLAAASLQLSGDLPRTGSLSLAELQKLGTVDTVWSKHKVTGVPLDKVLAAFGFTPGEMGKDVPKAEKRRGYRKVVVATAADGFQAVFSCAEVSSALGPTQALVIWELDGQPLSADTGPLRLVVPTDRETSRSLWQLVKLEVVDPAPKK